MNDQNWNAFNAGGFGPQGYPQAPQFPQQGGYPQFPQQQFAPAPQVNTNATAAQSLAQGSIDAFFDQPSVGGGPSLKFDAGTTHVGIVARKITNADIQQQTNPQNNAPATYKDGSPKFVMKVPLAVQPSDAYPDGIAQWYCAGGARDELVRAMAEAGAPSGPPEAGAMLSITCTGTRPSGPGMNPAKVYKIAYKRPDNPAPVEASNVVPMTAPKAVQEDSPAAPQVPDGLDADQQALMQRLLAQQNAA